MAIEEEESGGDIPEWVVTFGDMMSLLLTFFIMLVSLSEVKQEEKYQALVESMRRQFGHDRSARSMVPGSQRPRNSRMKQMAVSGRAKRMDTMQGGDKIRATVGDNPQVQSLRHAEAANLKNVVFFEYGSSELSEFNRQQLDFVVEEYRGKPLKIEIRGHTSLRPLPKGRAHYELAFARCQAVMTYLVAQGILRQRLVLSSAGNSEPLHLDDVELIGRNDRVEVVMLNQAWQVRAGTRREKEQRVTEELEESSTTQPIHP